MKLDRLSTEALDAACAHLSQKAEDIRRSNLTAAVPQPNPCLGKWMELRALLDARHFARPALNR